MHQAVGPSRGRPTEGQLASARLEVESADAAWRPMSGAGVVRRFHAPRLGAFRRGSTRSGA
eukprot:4834022-Alexandrium_andersonii.AAC.1